MRRYLGSFLLAAILFLFVGCDLLEDTNQTTSPDPSNVTPIEALIDTDDFHVGALEHIFEGEINRHGQAVGFHYEGLTEAEGEVIDGSASVVDENGVYEAKVKVSGTAKESNQGKSTFFPKEWDSQDVVDAINEAYDNKVHINGNTYEGLTDKGIVVRMYLDDEQNIISAFPQK